MVELTSEAIWAWTCLVARFLITSLVSFVDVGIFEFSMSSVSVMCAFQEMHPLPLSCEFKGKKLLITSPLHVCRTCNDVSLFFLQCGVFGGVQGWKETISHLPLQEVSTPHLCWREARSGW